MAHTDSARQRAAASRAKAGLTLASVAAALAGWAALSATPGQEDVRPSEAAVQAAPASPRWEDEHHHEERGEHADARAWPSTRPEPRDGLPPVARRPQVQPRTSAPVTSTRSSR